MEICRYTYAAAFNEAANAGDKTDALQWIRSNSGLVTAEPTLLKGSATSVACVACYPDRNIVAYMGTKTQFDSARNALQSVADWSENIKVKLVKFALSDEQLGAGSPAETNKHDLGGLVHDGFLQELRAVQDKVVATLLANGGRSRPVYVTGHSQGGAEAALATRALLAGGFPVVAAYTFAAPRAGDAAFVQSLPATLPIHRIEFGDDIVPHVPPTLISRELQQLAAGLGLLPFLPEDAKKLLALLQGGTAEYSFAPLGRLCYGSHKTMALRVDLSAEDEQALYNDRLWSLARHPERWAEHHHLAGTSDEVQAGRKGNYTALVSEFSLVS